MNALLKKGGEAVIQMSSPVHPRPREKLERRPEASPLYPKSSPEQGQWRGEMFVCTARDAERPLVSVH